MVMMFMLSLAEVTKAISWADKLARGAQKEQINNLVSYHEAKKK